MNAEHGSRTGSAELCGTDTTFYQAFDSYPVAFYATDPDGRITYFNPAAAKLAGRTPVPGEDCWSIHRSILLPDGRPLAREDCPMALALRGEAFQEDMELIAERPDGTRIWYQPHPAVFRDEHGKITGGLNMLLDITERKQRESASLLLSSIVDSSDDAIISKDLNGVITSWNKSAERLFGYTAEEAIGQAVASLLIPADRQGEEPEILSRLRKGERVDHFETKRKRKDGSLLDISLTISPVKNSRGQIVGASKIARDNTDQVQTREALRRVNLNLQQSNEDLEQFAYSASHDLQEPLRMISAYTGMLRKKYGDRLDEKAAGYLNYLTEGSMRMERLLRNLRAFTHASVNAEPAPEIDANIALRNTLTNLQAAIEDNGAEIVSVPLPRVPMHEFQLEQLFQNIIGNAIHYRSESPPRVKINVEPNGDTWIFSIEDNGIGIAAEYREKIFGMFKRLHTAVQYAGTGMGLAICQRIVERVGGRIWVESQPGRGSTFYFTVPAAGQGQIEGD